MAILVQAIESGAAGGLLAPGQRRLVLVLLVWPAALHPSVLPSHAHHRSGDGPQLRELHALQLHQPGCGHQRQRGATRENVSL